MEGSALHPTVDTGGVRRFDAIEVRIAKSELTVRPARTERDKSNELAARVFSLFRQGADLREVVISARVHPRLVRDLYSEWLVSLNTGEQHRRDAADEAEHRRSMALIQRGY